MRTNAEININGFTENILVKPFKCKSYSNWSGLTGITRGVLRIYPHTNEIEVKVDKGPHPYVWEILVFLLKDKDIRRLIKRYQQKGRIKPFNMTYTIGEYKDENCYINFPDETGLITEEKHLIHISCFGNISELKRMYIGDFSEMVVTLLTNSKCEICKTSCSYIKPRFAEKITTKVTKLI